MLHLPITPALANVHVLHNVYTSDYRDITWSHSAASFENTCTVGGKETGEDGPHYFEKRDRTSTISRERCHIHPNTFSQCFDLNKHGAG